MMTLLLVCIYAAFISLGLPDGLLGAAWPVMQTDINAPLSAAGVVSVIITAGTILSSLLSDRLTHRFGTGVVTVISVATTATALFGFAGASAFWHLCVWAIPYGLGAGAVDAALNNAVALHFKARHMSWLHCFWGVGASVGPYIMGAFLTGTHGWPGGYTIVAIIQVVITAGLCGSLPLFGRLSASKILPTASSAPLGMRDVLKISGVKAVVAAFFAYSVAEMTVMLWTSSYLTVHRHIATDTAASMASLFYLGMMVGRFLNGFVAEKFSDPLLIRVGIGVALIGTVLTALPVTSVVTAAGLLIIGLGCAPIYPCIIHSTPLRFGAERSGAIIGIEMAGAYMGSCIMPPVFGLVAEYLSMGLFPFFVGAFFILLWLMMRYVDRLHPIMK